MQVMEDFTQFIENKSAFDVIYLQTIQSCTASLLNAYNCKMILMNYKSGLQNGIYFLMQINVK